MSAPVPTRLTADQFWATWPGGKPTQDKVTVEFMCAFAEAYHLYAKEKERDNGAS